MSTTEYDFLTGEVCETIWKTWTLESFDKFMQDAINFHKGKNPEIENDGLLYLITDNIRWLFENKMNQPPLKEGFIYKAYIQVVTGNIKKDGVVICFKAKVGDDLFRSVEYKPFFDKYGFTKEDYEYAADLCCNEYEDE